MSLAIGNTQNLYVLNALQSAQKSSAQSQLRLSTGTRINSAADDPSGLVVSAKLTSQINGITQAVSNSANGQNLAQIADGALGQQQDILAKMQQLVVKAGDPTNDIGGIQTEMNNLVEQLNNLSSQTKYGSNALLDGTFTSKSFQIGANAGETVSLSIADTSSDGLGLTDSGVSQIDLSSDLAGALTLIESAMDTVLDQRSAVGSAMNQFSNAISYNQTALANLTAANNSITETDYAEEIANLTASNVKENIASAMLAQANSNSQNVMFLLQSMR